MSKANGNLEKLTVWLVCSTTVLVLMSCSTTIDSRSASDYSGHPSRVVIVPQIRDVLYKGLSQHFLDELAHSLEACGIAIERPPSGIDGAAVATARFDADAELLIRSTSYIIGGMGHSVVSETFDAQFVTIPNRRIVWHGTFSINNDNFFYDWPVQVVHDLVARLSSDGILKSCPQKP